MNNYKVSEPRKFGKTLNGYAPSEVDEYIENLLSERNKLTNEMAALKNKLYEYMDKEQLIQSAIISAEQTACNIKKQAEKEADAIIKKAQEEANSVVNNTSKESLEYKDNIYKVFYGYEHDLRSIIENFYSQAKQHMNQLELELIGDIERNILKYDSNFRNVFISKQQSNIIEKSPKDSLNEKWEQKELSVFVGKKLKTDLKDSNDNVLLNQNTIITPKILESVISKGLYGELIAAVNEDLE